ncbi:MAG: hypothetical protein QM765_37785 [Myxococcales bacterium]
MEEDLPLALGTLSLGDVPIDAAVAPVGAIAVEQGHPARLQGREAAVAAPVDVLEQEERLPPRRDLREGGRQAPRLLLGHEVEGGLPDELLGRVPEELLDPWADVDVPVALVDLPDPVGRLLDQIAEVALGPLQLVARALL